VESNKINKFLSIIDSISDTQKLMGVVVVAAVLVTTYDVVWRYIFGEVQVWCKDMEIFFYAWLMLMCAAYVLRLHKHIRVDIVPKRYLSRRGEEIILIIGYLFFFLPFCVITIIYGGDLAIKSIIFGEHFFSAWFPPSWPLRIAIPLAAFMLFLQACAELIRHFASVLKRST